MLVFADLSDAAIHSDAAFLNDCTWEKGDVFEMFLSDPLGADYLELHVTPNNQKLQVRVPRLEIWMDRDRRHAAMDGFLVPQEIFSSQVWIEEERWCVLARVPFSALGLKEIPEGDELLFSFCRYDTTPGTPSPVLSSSSPHKAENFHRWHEWKRLRFSKDG